jgi:hypothetical protein
VIATDRVRAVRCDRTRATISTFHKNIDSVADVDFRGGYCMIARLVVCLPFDFVVPQNTEFRTLEYHEGEYLVREFPPRMTDVPSQNPKPRAITLDGVEGIIANGLQIDFLKASFDRSQGTHWDPPRDLVLKCAERLLARLRFLISAPQGQVRG